ncbi:MAG: 3-hydroxyacyl-CoA dehydrogenase family protein [Planctomycetes bacterium]|nr:3-hydroxyacyl-CoA dehydrogenase family protein [Planctomycetota bacterium]
MGHGIAHVCAQAGCQVRLFDVKDELAQAGIAKIRGNLDKGVEKGKVTAADRDQTLARLAATSDLAGASKDIDLCVEAVPESLELKGKVFSTVHQHAPAHAILASNTSSLSLTALAAASGRPARTIGLHFFNPVHIMKLLEIVLAEQTAPDVLETCRTFGEGIGKTTIVVKDSPGFATSRLGLVIGLEAMRMVESGVASAEDIDKAMELGYGHPMGPLKLTDLVGLDVRLAIAEHLHKEVGEQFRPPALLRRLVRAGKLGKKTGEGFYRW